MKPLIRPATAADLPAINAIYLHYVLNSTCTYQIEPETPEQRLAWFNAHGDKHPIIVAELDAQVVGWGSLSQFHSRCAFERTVEDSIYVRNDMQGQGIGQALLERLIQLAQQLNHHVIIALIGADQPHSLSLHKKLGFQETGRLHQVGQKFNQWLDMVFLEKLL
jgi:L-amino acid N-acyltransferase